MWIELPWPENPANTYARKHWTAVSTLLGLISCVYRDLHHLRSNQRSQVAEPKLYNWANNPYRTKVTPNQLVMAIVRPINLYVSCKLDPYSLLRTRSPPGPRLPKRIRNTHPQSSVPLGYSCPKYEQNLLMRLCYTIIDIDKFMFGLANLWERHEFIAGKLFRRKTEFKPTIDQERNGLRQAIPVRDTLYE